MLEHWNRYVPSAARGARPGPLRRPASPTIDIHAHVGVPEAAALVKDHLDWSTIPLAHFSTPDTKAINQKQEEERASRMIGLDDRFADLDAMGIDMQVVMPTPFQCYHSLPIEIADRAARVVNNGVAELVARRPDRLIPFGTVPLQDGGAAADELERVVGELGFKGVQILTNVAGKELSDPEFAPFWAAAERLGVLVVIHPNGFTEGQRLSRFYFNNVIGNPFETTLALHYLIFDGVLARHPSLRILAVHGGGYLGAYHGRIDHVWGARSDANAGLPKPPSSYLRQVYFDTVVFTEHQLRYLTEVYGADHILMGTDYPYDMGEYDPVGHVMSTSGIDPATAEAICGGNAARLLGLGNVQPDLAATA